MSLLVDERSSIDLVRLIAARASDGGPLLALDHDGTLSPIAATPAAAFLPDATRDLVGRLAALIPVTILSGRGMADLEGRFDGLPVSLVAEHGLRERAADGSYTQLARPPDPDALAEVRTRISDLLAEHPDWVVEDKGVGIAVHHRNVSPTAQRELLPRVRAMLEAATASGGISVQAGHRVLELRASGANKGTALRHVAGLRPARPVVMIGDDLTDEPAFEVATELGGLGILVATEDRPTKADYRLTDPAAVATFLGALAAELAPD
jgi:trehalose-phosphatase